MRVRTRDIDAESLAALREKARHGSVNLEAMRARVVLAFFEGSSYAEIRTQYGWSCATTAKWIGRFRSQGLAGLGRKPRATPPPRVRGLLETWLPTVIHKSPRALGRERDRRTLESLQMVCEEQTGERPSLESIRLALHRFGHSWKRAKRTITSPDLEYEAKKGAVQALAEAAPAGSRVMFADQSDVGLYPPIGAQWGDRGVQDKVRTRGKNRKVYLFGALDAHTDQLHVGFWPRKNSDAFIGFLRALLTDVPNDTIHLVLDNYSVHKSKKTRAFLVSEEGRRIKPIFLPTYSPWLNPIEITWRIVKGRAATNRWRDSPEQTVADYTATMTDLGATVWPYALPIQKE